MKEGKWYFFAGQFIQAAYHESVAPSVRNKEYLSGVYSKPAKKYRAQFRTFLSKLSGKDFLFL